MALLDSRLQAVADEVFHTHTLADIGSDHGKIAVYAALNRLADKIIASDISADSADKARQLAKRYAVDISVRVGDGVSTLSDDEYGCAVIAGMGGIEIAGILSAARGKFDQYILVPHTKPEFLRRFLADNGIKADKDYKMECKGRYYDIIVCTIGEHTPSDKEIYYGKCEKSPIFDGFCLQERARLVRLIAAANGDKSAELNKRLQLLDDSKIGEV